jgi:hypothetical protein
MVHLVTVGSAFEGRVLVARLGADGILAQLRGGSEGPYPLPSTVDVLVDAAQVDEARTLLDADPLDADPLDADPADAGGE